MNINKTNSKGMTPVMLAVVIGLIILIGYVLITSINNQSQQDLDQTADNIYPTESPLSDSDEVEDLKNELSTTNFDDSELESELQELAKDLGDL